MMFNFFSLSLIKRQSKLERFVLGKIFQQSLIFATKAGADPFLLMVGYWPNLQFLDKAGKSSEGETF
jgi:hypothetical protein